MRTEAIQLVSTTAEKQDAEKLAQAVLDRRLAACVQISGPIESRYWWNGRIETATEWTLTIKTRHDFYKQVERLLLELHPYDEPEIMATPVVEISAGYLKWLEEQVSQPKTPAKKTTTKLANEKASGGRGPSEVDRA
jgi:periplasmic divalent cation tolerance protein